MAVIIKRKSLRSTIMSLICFVRNTLCILMCLSPEIHASLATKFAQLANADVKFDTEFSYVGYSLAECIKLCVQTPGCNYTSYHSNQTLCNLHAGNGTLTSSQGWRLYFKMFGETGETQVELKTGATASQSSTFDGLHALLALDGHTSGNIPDRTCAHTLDGPNTYWMMQLGAPGVVGKVELYLRSDYTGRNSNRSVLVAQSYDDGVNNVGIECGRYVGPLVTTPPFMLSFSCPLPIYGEFVRITMLSNDFMEVCEVFVYTQ